MPSGVLLRLLEFSSLISEMKRIVVPDRKAKGLVGQGCDQAIT